MQPFCQNARQRNPASDGPRANAFARIALAQRLRLRHTDRRKSLTEQLWFAVPGRRGFVNLTDTVAALVRISGVQEGLCLVNARHINRDSTGCLHWVVTISSRRNWAALAMGMETA